jgi:hypothetical protein
VEVDDPGWGIGGGRRLVEGDVAVGAEAEHGDGEPLIMQAGAELGRPALGFPGHVEWLKAMPEAGGEGGGEAVDQATARIGGGRHELVNRADGTPSPSGMIRLEPGVERERGVAHGEGHDPAGCPAQSVVDDGARRLPQRGGVVALDQPCGGVRDLQPTLSVVCMPAAR